MKVSILSGLLHNELYQRSSCTNSLRTRHGSDIVLLHGEKPQRRYLYLAVNDITGNWNKFVLVSTLLISPNVNVSESRCPPLPMNGTAGLIERAECLCQVFIFIFTH